MDFVGTTERLQETAGGITRAAEILRQGGTVALPTETVYGLGANALNPKAVVRIFAAKERPEWDPLIVHVADEAMLRLVVREIPSAALRLMEAFWPGPLTLLLPKSDAVPDLVTAGRSLVGVRMPRHPVMLQVIREAGVPVAAPSANRFGRTSPTSAAHVLEDLEGRIDAVLDGGATEVGVESTVVDPCQTPIVVYRPGAVTLQMLEQTAGPAVRYEPPAMTQKPESLPSPGVGIRHYAPRARVVLVRDQAELQARVASLGPERTGVLLPAGWTSGGQIFDWGRTPEEMAQRLFAGLRDLDSRGVTSIVCPLPPEHGVGAALLDRLRKAARVS
ncbi:L-threonylcarbamoyladenylate synthase [Terriglobus albidus]|uniref:L-threonylcarbamoyladenylate synthase n=1 Tax=Terriglobus albidus TaxID=1592106 RepID=UPI0021DFCA2B|nr:L-threonylcarbamoyladenylate synthase [Terriglobus albidus]